LEHLAKLATTAAELRIIPADAAMPPGAAAPFTLYELPPPCSPVVHLEHLGGWLLIEGEGAAPYATAYEHLQKAALSLAASPRHSPYGS
jgi:hypothetical protein